MYTGSENIRCASKLGLHTAQYATLIWIIDIKPKGECDIRALSILCSYV